MLGRRSEPSASPDTGRRAGVKLVMKANKNSPQNHERLLNSCLEETSKNRLVFQLLKVTVSIAVFGRFHAKNAF